MYSTGLRREKKTVRNEGCSLPSAANAIDVLEMVSFALPYAFNDMFYQLVHLIGLLVCMFLKCDA